MQQQQKAPRRHCQLEFSGRTLNVNNSEITLYGNNNIVIGVNNTIHGNHNQVEEDAEGPGDNMINFNFQDYMQRAMAQVLNSEPEPKICVIGNHNLVRATFAQGNVQGDNNTIHKSYAKVTGHSNTIHGSDGTIEGICKTIHGSYSKVKGDSNIIHDGDGKIQGHNNTIHGNYVKLRGNDNVLLIIVARSRSNINRHASDWHICECTKTANVSRLSEALMAREKTSQCQ